MMTLIIGGSGSGKSGDAEEYTDSLSDGIQKIYLATMQVYDEEGKKKVEKHRKMRQDKHFTTIEQPVRIEDALQEMKPGEKTVLLECMSNLVANEMFSKEQIKSPSEVADSVIYGIETLRNSVTHLVVVSNNVFEDGGRYDNTVRDYIKTMGVVNERLAKLADEVTEVVVGIPIMLKQEGK